MLKWLNKHLIRILLPIFIVAVVIGAVNSDQEKIGCTIATTGTVIETNIRTQRVDGGKYHKDRTIYLHTPTIRYIVDGKSYEKEFSGSIEPIWQAGQEVQILYNPHKPKVSILPEEHDEYASRYTNGGTILRSIACIVFFVVSICIGTWMDKSRERNALEKQAKIERIESGEEEKKRSRG